MARRPRMPDGPDLFDALRDKERLEAMQSFFKRPAKSAADVMREYYETVDAAAKSAPVIHGDPE